MSVLAPTVSLNAPANRPYSPPPVTAQNIARARDENDAIIATQFRHYQPGVAGRRGTFAAELQESQGSGASDTNGATQIHEISSDAGTDSVEEYEVEVHMSYKETEQTAGGKVKVVGKTAKKRGSIALEGMTRVNFARFILRVHNVHDRYAPRADGGFPFKLAFCGPRGGMKTMITIDEDEDFARELEAMKRQVDTGKMSVRLCLRATFDTSELEPWKITKRGVPDAFAGQPNGTSVPRLENMSQADQLHGSIIRQIEGANRCAQHPAENGGPGFCWVGPDGRHVRLTWDLLQKWAAALAAGVYGVSPDVPPNTPDFDRGEVRPRGRAGPGHRNSSEGSSNELLMTAMTTMTTLTAAIAAKMMDATPAPLPSNQVNALIPATPTAPRTPARQRVAVTVPFSPYPALQRDEIAWFIDQFARRHPTLDFDSEAVERTLTANDLLPGLINRVPDERLERMLGLSLGKVIILKTFAGEWAERLDEKRRAPSVEV